MVVYQYKNMPIKKIANPLVEAALASIIPIFGNDNDIKIVALVEEYYAGLRSKIGQGRLEDLERAIMSKIEARK